MTDSIRTQAAIDPDTVCLTVDVEWAHPEILADLVRQLDQRGLRATFFCTHDGIEVPGHERALHPNFRRAGDTMKRILREAGEAFADWGEPEIYRRVVAITQAFAPEAVGVRSHSLYYDSDLLPVYRRAGLRYDSSCFLPLAPGLTPVCKEHDILELPIYYMDHIDLVDGMTGYRVEDLRLDRPGLKVLDFHPNIVFVNPSNEGQYLASKRDYSNPERLLEQRLPGRGARSLFLDLLDHLASRRLPVATLGEVNAAWRASRGEGGGRSVPAPNVGGGPP